MNLKWAYEPKVVEASDTLIEQRLRHLHEPQFEENPYLILENPEKSNTYMQTIVHQRGRFQVEYRDGVDEKHYRVTGVNTETTVKLLLSYFGGGTVWRKLVAWRVVSDEFFGEGDVSITPAQSPIAGDPAPPAISEADRVRERMSMEEVSEVLGKPQPSCRSSGRSTTNDLQWHYHQDGEQHGPISQSDIERLITHRVLRREALVWREGLDSWSEAATQFRFAELPQTTTGNNADDSNAMDFYTARRVATRHIWLMVCFGFLIISATIGVLYGLLIIGVAPPYINWSLLGVVSCFVIGLGLVFYLYRLYSLQGGGRAITSALGAYEVPSDTDNREHRRLVAINKEIAIAAGVTPLPVYLYDDPYINAFAGGFSLEDSVVAVTVRALSELTRDELSGVVAHEYGHVLDGDCRTKTHMIALCFGLMPVAIIGILACLGGIITFSKARKDGKGVGIALLLFGAVVICIGLVGVVGLQILRAAISRQQEYRADINGVALSRCPAAAGLASALKKMLAEANNAEMPLRFQLERIEFSHLFISGNGFSRLLATHPSFQSRIHRLLYPRTRQTRRQL